MSRNPPAPSPDDTLQAERCSSADEEKPRITQEQPSVSPPSGEQDLARSQSASYPTVPVEPPLEPTQVRSIGVHSILNPPATAAADLAGKPGSGEGLGLSSAAPSSRSQQPSFLADHATHQGRRVSLSPGIGQRPILPPASPSARLVRAASGNPSYSGPASASYSPLGHESTAGLYSGPSIATHPPMSAARHSMPPLPSPRVSAGLAANPSSLEASPSTSHVPFGQFERSSATVANLPVPQVAPPFPPGYMPDPLAQLASVAGGQRHMADEPQPGSAFLQGKIPFFVDMKSGSSSQAAKRKANSDASRRFRHRKRNGEEMEKKVAAQQDEIRKQTETMQRQAEEIRTLMVERNHYRSERDFYREQASRALPQAQIMARPPSPPSFRLSASEKGSDSPWHGVEGKAPWAAVVGGRGGSLAAGQPSSTTQDAAGLSYIERGNVPDKETRSSPQPPRTWPA